MERESNAAPEGVLNMSDPRREQNENFIVSSIVPWHSKHASIRDVSMMHCREVCVGTIVQTPNFAFMALSCSMIPRNSGSELLHPICSEGWRVYHVWWKDARTNVQL